MSEAHQAAVKDRPEFWDILGGVRFGLALIVMIGHLSMFKGPGIILRHIGYLSAPTAVFCFLVISGYSIAASLARDQSQFYRRRILRVYPLYLLAILMTLVVARKIRAADSMHQHNVMGNLLFMQTFVVVPLPVDAVVWTLAVEVACYILAPWFHSRRSGILLIIGGISAAGFAVFPWLHLQYYSWLPHGAPLFFLLWSWLAGFIYYRHRHEAFAGIVLLVTMIVLTTINPVYAQPWHHITIICSMGLLVGARQVVLSKAVRNVLSYLGNLSFPLYLMHLPVYRLFHDGYLCSSTTIYLGGAFAASAGALVFDLRARKAISAAIEICDEQWIFVMQWTEDAVKAIASYGLVDRPSLRGVYSIARFVSLLLTVSGIAAYSLRPRAYPAKATDITHATIVTRDVAGSPT